MIEFQVISLILVCIVLGVVIDEMVWYFKKWYKKG